MGKSFDRHGRRGEREDPHGISAHPPGSPRRLAAQLRAGIHPPDQEFDKHLPAELRAHSSIHWTPLAAASRAASWFEKVGVRTVVDIGSGVGKFCIAGALAGSCRYLGIEQRPYLVVAARRLANLFAVDHMVHFVEGRLGEIEVPAADAYYFYNPFGENLLDEDGRIDPEVELGVERRQQDLEHAEQLLQRATAGTYVLTYHGIGKEMPSDYQEVRFVRSSRGVLRLWRKGVPAPSDYRQ